MKQINFKALAKYIFSLLLAGSLFWYIYKDQDIGEMLRRFSTANLWWIFASVTAAIFSHVSRAWRWKIAMRPMGYHLPVGRAFMAVMIGYFANVFVPRLGEVARCGILKRTDNIPVNLSFGAVLTERAFDLIILLSLTFITVVIEFDVVGSFLIDSISSSSEALKTKFLLLGVGGLFFLLVLGLLYLNRHRFKEMPFYETVLHFFLGIKDGLLSVRKLSASARYGYLFHTINIWVMYYLMAYLIFFAVAETKDLGMMCGLSVLIMGGLGMVIPTPGGAGSYHLFVTATLLAYGLTESAGKYFAFLMHSTQMVMILILGGLMLLLSFLLKRRTAKITVVETAAVNE